MNEVDADILVIGGGLVGSVFSLAAAKDGFTVAIVDSAPPRPDAVEFDGRAYALSLSSLRLLSSLGFADMLSQHGETMKKIQITDGRPGEGAAPGKLEFSAAEIEYGPMGCIIEDRHLRKAVCEAAARSEAIQLSHNSAIQRIFVEGNRVRAYSKDTAFSGRIIVGCDGQRSLVATSAGIKRARKNYGQSAIVCAVEHEKPHNGTAFQFFMPSGPLAILPLRGNRSSLVWTIGQHQAEQLSHLDDSAFLEELIPRFGMFLGRLNLVGKRAVWPLALVLAERLAAHRTALLGEAAHSLHPLAGQGMNLGFRDAASLAQVLSEAARRGEDIGDLGVLERFQRWRRFDIAAFAVATDSCNRLFGFDHPTLRALRGIGMLGLGKLPMLKRAIIREAAGISGQTPQILG